MSDKEIGLDSLDLNRLTVNDLMYLSRSWNRVVGYPVDGDMLAKESAK